MTGVLEMRKWTTKRSLERRSGQAPGHGGLSGFYLTIAQSSSEFMEEAIQIEAAAHGFKEFTFLLVN